MPAPERFRVLIVDDDATAVRLLSKHLTLAGYEVLTANNGTEAMKILLAEGPPVVITDWVMPEMDGLELCRAIRTHEGIAFTFVIIITAQTEEERVVEAFEAGADDYLTKPLHRRELLARLRAGERITRLQRDLDRRTRDVHRINAEMEIAHADLAMANGKLHLMATVDELTGLTNRREALSQLDDCWAVSLRHNEPLSCIYVDIDHFKSFNDLYGHAVGDLVLKQIAQVLNDSARSADRTCRVGGEEFLILCPRTPEFLAANGAERLRQAVESHSVKWEQAELSVTVSVGVAERTPNMIRPDDLITAADTALYAAKGTGRNRVCCVSTLQAAADKGKTDHGPRKEAPAAPLLEMTTSHEPVVLMVDDDPSIRALCRRLLEREGYRVNEATDGLEALEQVRREVPDVIIMDVLMPNLGGLDCTRRLKGDPATANIPVVMFSSRTDVTDVVAGLESGADEYLTKPLDPKELLLRVRTMVRLGTELTESNAVRGEQTRALELLLNFSHRTAAADTLDAALDATIAVTAELTCSRRVSIMLPDQERNNLTIARAIGIDEATASAVSVPVGAGTAGVVFASAKPVVINTPEEAGRRERIHDATFFASVPLVSMPLSAPQRVVGVLNITDREGDRPFTSLELEYVDLISNVAASAIEERLTRRARDEARDSIVIALAKLAEHRDPDTGRHVERVTRFSIVLAGELGRRSQYKSVINTDFLGDLERSVPLHDIGKVGVPDLILCKPGRLTPDEIDIMRTHAEIGARTIQSVIERVPDSRFLKMARDIALHHHEWFNGQGYPLGISGETIPLAARIVAVADVYDALTTKRIYKDAIPHERAMKVVLEAEGAQFDPDVIAAFRRCEHELERLARELTDDEGGKPCGTPADTGASSDRLAAISSAW